MQDNEGFLSYSTDYGYSWSLLNILNIVDESIYTISGVGGKQDGEYYILITHISNIWQNAHTYILHSTDYGITFDLHHTFSKGDEPLFSNFSAKSDNNQNNNSKYDSSYFVNGELPLEVQFYNYSIGDINLYEWDFDNDGTIDSYEENPVFIYSDTGWYSVNLTVYDEFDTNSFLRENYIYIDKTTGISKNKKFDIECYPNPFSEHITIQLPMYNRYKINVLEIYDISGKIIKTINTIENAITWNGKSNSGQKCNRGIYFLKLKNNSFIKKILLTN